MVWICQLRDQDQAAALLDVVAKAENCPAYDEHSCTLRGALKDNADQNNARADDDWPATAILFAQGRDDNQCCDLADSRADSYDR